MGSRDSPPQVSLLGEILHRLRCRVSVTRNADDAFRSGVMHAAGVVVRCCRDRETGVMLARVTDIASRARTRLKVMKEGSARHREDLVELIELSDMLTSILVNHEQCHDPRFD